MALIGYEWLIIVGIILVIFLWGPKKLPELARSIGLAKKEFEKSTKEIASITNPTTTPTPENEQDPLLVAAKSLSITTEGKTKEQITKEIADKTTQK
ncbi:MAG: twin-arginine translocase TatA/TatE family subunit [Candidatus Bathyarchaeia archaeon]